MPSNSEKKPVSRPLIEYFRATSTSTLPLVKVYVGPQRELFIFPEALICDKLKFFKAAFQGGFRETTGKTIDLPEDDPIAFSLIMDRAMTGTLYLHEHSIDKEEVQMQLCKAYVLADKLGEKDIAMCVNIALLEFIYGPGELRIICPRAAVFVYNHKIEMNTLRRDMVQIMAESFDGCFSAESMEKWLESATSHPKFHADTMIKIRQNHALESHARSCNLPSCKVHTAEFMAQIDRSEEFL